MDFADRYGKMAVIAGGSEGVGAAYAIQLAERGLDLTLVARKQEQLDETAERIRVACPGREVLAHSVDLAAPDAAATVQALTGDREVGMLVYNAGASSRSGDFVDGEIDFARDLLAVNGTTMMALAHGFGRKMKDRGRGGMILVSSFAYMVGNPGLAAYSGSKAFLTLFAEALWFELKDHGVEVLAHVLGMTDTPANARNFPHMGGMGEKAGDLARQGLENLGNGPVLWASGGDQLAKFLAPLDRASAVEHMYEAGAAFREV